MIKFNLYKITPLEKIRSISTGIAGSAIFLIPVAQSAQNFKNGPP